MRSWTHDKNGIWRPITDCEGKPHLWYLLETMAAEDIAEGKRLASQYGGEAPEEYLREYLVWRLCRDELGPEPVD